jgi:flagellin FlaB
MKANRLAKDEGGDFGVGTMIIFIAMIVVAVVAATVIITVMNKLQGTAERTGTDAIAMVSSGVHIKSIIGDRRTQGLTLGFDGFTTQFLGGNPQSEIQKLTILVELRAGSMPLDLDRTIFRVVTPRDTVEFDGAPNKDENVRAFSKIVSLRDSDQSISNEHVLNYIGDAASVELDINDLYIGPGESFAVQIIPDVGGIPTVAQLQMPLTYPQHAEQVELYP